ncbi:hypothetical protein ACOTVS_11195 [Aliarcobacter butzleri]|uniref:hypothetical protein n=1 Tax=Aliarcobacter butzleri TaxID=28197 RepID=UPI00344E06DD
MKKIILLVSISIGLYAFDCPLGFFNKMSQVKCPKTLLQENTAESNKNVQAYLKELDSVQISKEIYIDVLKKLHDIEDASVYINKVSFNDFTETQLFEKLMSVKMLKQENRYQEYLEKVDANNPYWCVTSEKGE